MESICSYEGAAQDAFLLLLLVFTALGVPGPCAWSLPTHPLPLPFPSSHQNSPLSVLAFRPAGAGGDADAVVARVSACDGTKLNQAQPS